MREASGWRRSERRTQRGAGSDNTNSGENSNYPISHVHPNPANICQCVLCTPFLATEKRETGVRRPVGHLVETKGPRVCCLVVHDLGVYSNEVENEEADVRVMSN